MVVVMRTLVNSTMVLLCDTDRVESVAGNNGAEDLDVLRQAERISNPKSEIVDWTVQFEFSDFG